MEVVDFSDPFMTFNTVILIKKPASGADVKYKTLADLTADKEIKFGLVKDGATQNYFRTSQNATLKQINASIHSDPNNVVSNSEEGVRKSA